ncbi:MAG: hypothetical protein HPY65_13325 [Syntrophaceae bacterium]|nr:hypothetical protein [Syntrophaceae bacterium]
MKPAQPGTPDWHSRGSLRRNGGRPCLAGALLLWVLLTLAPAARAADESYSFDLSEIEKKSWHIGGYAEVRPVRYRLNPDGAFYKLRFYNRHEGDAVDEYNGRLQLEGSYEKGIARLYMRTNTDYRRSYTGETEKTSIYEGYGSLRPSASFKIDAGKKNLKWGKGYAWNPAAFLDRPKDPDDPELPMEGYIVLTADWIRSFDGPLKTVSFSPVVLPVHDHVNDEFGAAARINVAGKLYLLLYDTDIDLMVLADGSRTTRFGFDFSRNWTSNFEIHGEFAWIRDHAKTRIDAAGSTETETYNAFSGLIGLRYLTTRDTTIIAEYYHSGTGYTAEEMKGFYAFVNRGWRTYLAGGSDGILQRALLTADGTYGRPNPMRDYLYLRIVQKEPFDILYFTPALTVMANLNDGGYTVSPEAVYTRITNLELRLKASFLYGGPDSEFGEKQNRWRIEFRAGYSF